MTFGRDGLITALQMLWWSPGRGARRVAPLGGLSGHEQRRRIDAAIIKTERDFAQCRHFAGSAFRAGFFQLASASESLVVA